MSTAAVSQPVIHEYGLIPPHILYHWTKTKADDTRQFKVNGNYVRGGFPPAEELFRNDGVEITLSRSTKKVNQHYHEGDEPIEATDCFIKIDHIGEATWPKEENHRFVWCARLEISFPADKPNHILIFYKSQNRSSSSYDFGEWKSAIIRYK